MQYSVVNKSLLNEEFRIDSEYYSPDNLIRADVVERSKYELLGDICTIIAGPFGSTVTTEKYDPESGCRYIRGKDIQSFFVKQSDSVFIDKHLFDELSQFHLKPNDILLTVVGMKFGKSAIVYDEDCPAIFSCKSTLLRDPKVNVYYLVAYLSSDIGYGLVRRGQRGAAQPGINLFDIKNVPVPILSKDFQSEIASLVCRAKLCIVNSSDVYQKTQELLLSELGLSNWQPKHQLSFVKNYSDTEQVGRIDAEYFQPKYDEIVKAIKSYPGGWATLENLCELVGHPSNPPYADTQDEKKTFIVTQKHLGDYSLNDEFWKDDDALYTTDEFIKNNSQYKLREEDILLYSVGAYIGKANIYKGTIKATIGSFLTMLRVKKDLLNPYYLMVFLNTDIGGMISKQHQRGMAQQYLYPYDIRTFPVPILKDDMQQGIQNKITESFNLSKQSKHLLECAKRAVEIAIEQDEDAAIKWLQEQTEERVT